MSDRPRDREEWVTRIAAALRGTLPGHLGVDVVDVGEGTARGRLIVERRHLHPGGFVHSAAIACLAESVAAWATITLLDEGEGFSTIEFKSNFFTAVDSGTLVAESRALHRGRHNVVLESQVVDHEGRFVALMVVTQTVLDGPRTPVEPAAEVAGG